MNANELSSVLQQLQLRLAQLESERRVVVPKEQEMDGEFRNSIAPHPQVEALKADQRAALLQGIPKIRNLVPTTDSNCFSDAT